MHWKCLILTEILFPLHFCSGVRLVDEGIFRQSLVSCKGQHAFTPNCIPLFLTIFFYCLTRYFDRIYLIQLFTSVIYFHLTPIPTFWTRQVKERVPVTPQMEATYDTKKDISIVTVTVLAEFKSFAESSVVIYQRSN